MLRPGPGLASPCFLLPESRMDLPCFALDLPRFLLPASCMDLPCFVLDLNLPCLDSCLAWTYLASPWTWTCLALLPFFCLAHGPACFALDMDLPRLASCFLTRAWTCLALPWTWICLAHGSASLCPGPGPASPCFLLPALCMDLPHFALDLDLPRLASCFPPRIWTCLALPLI